ncbi:MAG: hypothetical protein AB7P12_12120 [Alphaproteobacteria bacterium]
MTARSKRRNPSRVRLRIPWMIELEGEGLVAVVGSFLLAAFVVGCAVIVY